MPDKILPLLFCVLISCDQKREALGSDNEIHVICSEVDREIIEKYLSKIFIDTIFTPEPEPYYYLKYSSPESYTDLKFQSKIVVAAVNRDTSNQGYLLVKKMLSPIQFEKMERENPVIIAKDIHAKNQLFVVINAKSDKYLLSTIKEKQNQIRKLFNEQFIVRQNRFLFGNDRKILIEDSIKNEFGWSIKIPWGWEVIKKSGDSNFVWLGKERPFQWISIASVNGNLALDQLTAGNFIWNWPIDNYGFIKFNNYKFELDQAFNNNSKAWRAQGIWETIDIVEAKGGPFRSYMFFDEYNNKTYHINYLIHYPGKDKSIYMRQMDMIANTFNQNAL